jgi:DNA mismatch endonuclease (patch repair protein)
MDIVDSVTRSKMMSGIKNINTKPELLIRKALADKGFQFSLHNGHLPGKPDIVLPYYGAVILINGCFWHKHECQLFKWPVSNKEFWQRKIESNFERDKRNVESLLGLNWRVCTIWECIIRKNKTLQFPDLIERLLEWLTGNKLIIEIDSDDTEIFL